MAKNKVEIDVKVDDKGTTKKVGLGAKKAGESIDGATRSSDKYSKKQKRGCPGRDELHQSLLKNDRRL